MAIWFAAPHKKEKFMIRLCKLPAEIVDTPLITWLCSSGTRTLAQMMSMLSLQIYTRQGLLVPILRQGDHKGEKPRCFQGRGELCRWWLNMTV